MRGMPFESKSARLMRFVTSGLAILALLVAAGFLVGSLSGS